jgi:hypothetical protein
MLMRHPNLLTAGVLLLSMGGIAASALPHLDGRPESAVERVQLNDGGRCFNQCVIGRIFRSCQTASEGKTQNCCSDACTKFNNRVYSEL